MNTARRTRIRLSALSMMILMISHGGNSQYLSSSRSIGLAATLTCPEDVSALDLNAAGMVNLNNWEFSLTSYYSPTGSDHSLTLHTLGMGKQFGSTQFVAIKLSPGSALDFVVPSTIIIDSTQSLQFDKKINYQEQLALGYALQLRDNLALGWSLHEFSEKVTDTRYSVDTNFIIRTETVEYTGNKTTVDAGLIWSIDEAWRAGVVVKNLFTVEEKTLDASVQQYDLNTPAILRAGIAYHGFKNILVAVDADTKRQIQGGWEWSPGSSLKLEGGLYVNASSSIRADAAAIGAGIEISPVRFDLSYLAFFSQDDRKGKANVNDFLQSGVSNIDYNQFTSDRLSLTVKVNLAPIQESFAHIEYVNITADIFPASRMLYALQPIGTARVRNVTTQPIEARVSFFIDGLMEAPTQMPPNSIPPGEVVEVPIYAVFNDAVRSLSSMSVRQGEVYVTTAASNTFNDRYQTRVLVHGKNDWNGDVGLLKYFVTPDDPDILRFTRSILSENKTAVDTVVGALQNLQRARVVFNEFAKRLTYVNDPKKSEDFVQYPSETLQLHGGDCDDMSVCYSSLLASMGISTAFIDVVPPEHPEQSHIYMMFDAGVDAKHASLISDNPKRYVVRKNEQGKETAWIPVETTLITKGFDEAWNLGAREYLDDVDVHLGLVKGWVRVVDFVAIN